MEANSTKNRTQRVPLDVDKRWRFDLGPVGATAAIAAVAALAVAFALGLIIPNIVEQRLLESTANSIKATVDEIAKSVREGQGPSEVGVGALETEIEHRLLGRDIVRVKIWDASGTILFSDERRLVGKTYEMSHDLVSAFSGELIWEAPDLSRPENEFERELGELREYYVPVDDGTQGVELVFEVYEVADNLVATLDSIRTAVWAALGLGAAALLIALVVAAVANARAETKQKARSERLIGQLLEIQDVERMRIIGALHDDIGQPLYRIMFGLAASQGMVEEGSDVHTELAGLDALVRDVDATLRHELTALRDEPGVEIDLESALAELVEVTEGQTNLDVTFASDVETTLPQAHRATLYRAAKEALANVERHAYADHVTVRLVEGRDSTMIEVIDDGAGSTGQPGLGLTTTRDRLEAIGGGVVVSDAHGGGTRFVAWVPNRNEELA